MQNLTASIPHQLPRAEAKKRIEELVTQFQQQYGGLGKLDARWNDDTMTFALAVMGVTVPGRVDVDDKAVRIEMTLPWLLAQLGASFKQQIETEGRKRLERQ
jgi:putative polyhydroxyalkanoate system protein